jgi:hypothetical protein
MSRKSTGAFAEEEIRRNERRTPHFSQEQPAFNIQQGQELLESVSWPLCHAGLDCQNQNFHADVQSVDFVHSSTVVVQKTVRPHRTLKPTAARARKPSPLLRIEKNK